MAEEVRLAIRVLATIPALPLRPAEGVARAQPAPAERSRSSRVLVSPDSAPAPETSPRKPRVQPAERPRFQRRKSRAIFPSGSITVLTVIAVAIWSYVAIRDMKRPGKSPAVERIATETPSNATGTTRR